jgi:hypothetical protein
MKMKPANQKMLTGRHVLMVAVLSSTFAAVDRAEACTVGGLPSTFASNSVVDCSGTTTNSGSSGHDGYGTSNDNNNTYNIEAGAKVTGDEDGVKFGTGATFNISGAITGTSSVGIFGFGGTTTITNTSTGSISGHNGMFVDTLNLNNAGQILALEPNGGAIQASRAGWV